MDDKPPGERDTPEPERDDAGWLPLIAGLLGLVVGAGLGGLVGLKDGTDTALKLAAIGGFMGMVLVVVPVNSRQRARRDGDRPPDSDRPPSSVLSRLSRSPFAARVPQGGLPTRSVPNRNADITGRIEEGIEVRVVRRSGNWARIQTDADEDPIWLERRRLEPTDAPPERP